MAEYIVTTSEDKGIAVIVCDGIPLPPIHNCTSSIIAGEFAQIFAVLHDAEPDQTLADMQGLFDEFSQDEHESRVICASCFGPSDPDEWTDVEFSPTYKEYEQVGTACPKCSIDSSCCELPDGTELISAPEGFADMLACAFEAISNRTATARANGKAVA
ncbi:MAG: hypothetical protein AAF432_00540 [Planctomycetota bacterium]